MEVEGRDENNKSGDKSVNNMMIYQQIMHIFSAEIPGNKICTDCEQVLNAEHSDQLPDFCFNQRVLLHQLFNHATSMNNS
jgi:hypothetical protein